MVNSPQVTMNGLVHILMMRENLKKRSNRLWGNFHQLSRKRIKTGVNYVSKKKKSIDSYKCSITKNSLIIQTEQWTKTLIS